jgi:hypothetical protein
MPIQITGPISFSNLRSEFGGTGAISLGSYYRGGSRVPNDNFVTLNAFQQRIPASGAIKISDFYGTTNGNTYVDITGRTLDYTPPPNTIRIQVTLGSAGGGGVTGYMRRMIPGFRASWSHDAVALNGGAGGLVRDYIFQFVPRDGMYFKIIAGVGGAGAKSSATETCLTNAKAGNGGRSVVEIYDRNNNIFASTPWPGGGGGAEIRALCVDNWQTNNGRLAQISPFVFSGGPGLGGPDGISASNAANGVIAVAQNPGGETPKAQAARAPSPDSGFAGFGGGAMTGRVWGGVNERGDNFRENGGNGRVRLRI